MRDFYGNNQYNMYTYLYYAEFTQLREIGK